MEWTKIPTDLLQSATDDKDILAIVKYQLLWAILEREPEEKICLRYMTSKQLQRALDYTSAIQRRVNADISSVVCNRNRQKMFYLKNQTLKEKPNGYNNGYTNEADKNKIRIDNINTILKNSNIKDAVEKWVSYKKERGQSYKPTGLKVCIEKLEKLSNNDPKIAMDIVNESISNNWSGLFALKETKHKQEEKSVWERNKEKLKQMKERGEL